MGGVVLSFIVTVDVESEFFIVVSKKIFVVVEVPEYEKEISLFEDSEKKIVKGEGVIVVVFNKVPDVNMISEALDELVLADLVVINNEKLVQSFVLNE